MFNSTCEPKQVFIRYVMSFYGPGQIYDYGFTVPEVKTATEQHINTGRVPFEGDSIDREIVRDIVLDNRKSATKPHNVTQN